jgi:hypothetical protein
MCRQRAPGPPRIICRDIPSVSIARLAGVPRLRPVACRDLGAPEPHHMAALVCVAALLGNTVGSATTARAARSGMLRPARRALYSAGLPLAPRSAHCSARSIICRAAVLGWSRALSAVRRLRRSFRAQSFPRRELKQSLSSALSTTGQIFHGLRRSSETDLSQVCLTSHVSRQSSHDRRWRPARTTFGAPLANAAFHGRRFRASTLICSG